MAAIGGVPRTTNGGSRAPQQLTGAAVLGFSKRYGDICLRPSHRLFIANDRESIGIARFSRELQVSRNRCRTMKNGHNRSHQDLRVGYLLVRSRGLQPR
jgi:hypothetical protein